MTQAIAGGWSIERTNNTGESAGLNRGGEGWSRSDLLTMGVLLAGGLLLRAVFLGCQRILHGDEIHYAESLFHFMRGNFMEGFSGYWNFFYPFMAIPFGFVSGGAEEGLRVLSLIAGTMVIIPVALVADRLWGRRAAIFAAILTAIHPFLIVSSTSAETSSLYTLFLILFIYFLIVFVLEGGRWNLVGMALAGGLGYLTRPEAQLFILLAVLIVLPGRGGRGLKAGLGRRIGRAVVILSVFALTVLPQLLLTHHKTGRWSTGSKASINLSSPLIWQEGLKREEYVYSLNQEGTGRRIRETGRENPLVVLWRQRSQIASRYAGKFINGTRRMPELLSSPLLLLLFPLGIFGRRWERGKKGAELILILAGLFPFLLYSIFRVQIRYLIPFVPVYLLWCASGCQRMVVWLRENFSVRWWVGAAVLFFIFISLVPFTVRKYSLIRQSYPVYYREVGGWIRENLGDHVRILAHSGCPVSYYAGNPEATFIPWVNREGLMNYARRKGYGFLIVDEDYFRNFRPQMKGLVEGISSDYLDPVKRFIKPSGSRIIIYEITPTADK